MALLDLKTFRAQFPEFRKASDVVVSYVLEQAGRRTPASVWGELQSEGHGLLTAHMLCLRPEGKDMRMGDGHSLYGKQRKHLNCVVSSGFRVTK